MNINGTLLWYYNICKREVWLMYRNIVPDQHNDNIELGKFIHEYTYNRNDKEIAFGNVKFDVIFKNKKELIIGETKKSSKYNEASKWQLMFYLNVLKKAGINAKGALLYPEERKRTEVILDKNNEDKLENMIEDIKAIALNPKPPKIEKCKYCKNCGYREYCYS